MSTPAEISRLIEESRAFERSGSIAAAIRQARRACELAQACGDEEGEALALITLSYAYIRLGSYAEARAFCQQALALVDSESPSRADALLNIGICAGETDDLNTLEECARLAVGLSRQIGYDRALVRGLHSLSCGVYMPRGQFSLSLALDEEALNIARARGLEEMAWGPLLTMSWVHWLMGQPSLAEARLAELHPLAAPGSLGDGYWHFIHASLALEAGELARAKELFTSTLSIAEANGIAENLFLARLGLSRLSRAAGDAPAALAWASEALTIAERAGYQHLQGQARIERGRAAWALGDLPSTEADLRAAVDLLAPQKLDFDLAAAWLLLAALLRKHNRPGAPAAWQEAAARLAQGGFASLVERERALSFPLIAAGIASPDPATAVVSAALLEHLQRVPPPPLKIITLGSLQVRVGGRLVDSQALRQRKAGELLGLLLITPTHAMPVEQLIDALWADKEPDTAQTLFHHATSTLRRALEPDLPEKFPSRYLEVRDGQVTLRLPPASTVDYEVFADHYRRGQWAEALACYGGEFLPHYRYADWALPHRQWLAQDYQRALLERGRLWLAEGCWVEALGASRAILAAEPWHESAVLLGMQACLGLNDRSGAIRTYKKLEKGLRDELDIAPQPEIQNLYHSLLKR